MHPEDEEAESRIHYATNTTIAEIRSAIAYVRDRGFEVSAVILKGRDPWNGGSVAIIAGARLLFDPDSESRILVAVKPFAMEMRESRQRP